MYVMTFYNLITLKKSCVSGKLTNNYLRIMTLDETDECPMKRTEIKLIFIN